MAKVTGTHTFLLTSYDSSKLSQASAATLETRVPSVIINNDPVSTAKMAQFNFKHAQTSTFGYKMALDKSVFPSGATITACSFRTRTYASNASKSGATSFCRFTWGENKYEINPIASSYSTVKRYNVDISNLTLDDFTGEVEFLVSLYYTADTTMYCCGAALDVTYEYDVGGDTFFIKKNGVWNPIDKVFMKVNGSWVEQNYSILTDEGISQLIIGGDR